MEIFDTLRMDHAAIRTQLDRLIQISSFDGANLSLDPSPDCELSAAEDWAQVFFDLKKTLRAHDRAEESVLYEMLARIPNREDLADIKTEEHHMAEETLQDLEELNLSDDEWSATLALFKNQLESHVAEEETFVFSLLEEVLTDEEGQMLAQQFDREREEYLEQSDLMISQPTSQPALYCEYPRRM